MMGMSMTTNMTHAEHEISDGLVQLRFADDDGNVRDIDAAELAEVLQGLVELTSQLAKAGAFGDGIPPQVRVRPPKEGSFIVEAIVVWSLANPEAALGMALTTGATLAKGIDIGLKKLRGLEPTDFEFLDNGDVKLKWPGNKVDQIPVEVWNQLRAMKRPTRKALRKIMAPLGDDVQRLEVRQGRVDETTDELLNTPPEAVADLSDFRSAALEPVEAPEVVTSFDAEARLRSIDFRPGEKWRVETNVGSRLAYMDDPAFLLELDRGMALHKNDIFNVKIREIRTTTDGRMSREWFLIDVKRKRRGDEDDNDAPTSS
jgi:hypothetical protein